MKDKIIVANWKMHGSKKLCDEVINELSSIKLEHQVVICPPLLYIDYLHRILGTMSNVNIGAQDCSKIDSYGAYTGDINCNMLAELGVKYVILGHSERRQNHDEKIESIAEKVNIAAKHSIIPIVCMGSDTQDDNITIDLLSAEIEFFMERIPDLTDKIIIAYEPVWAIGSGSIPTSEHIYTIIELIKRYGKFKVIYGGSVNNNNAQEIMQVDGLSGLLTGGASLKPKIFREIIERVDSVS